MTAIPSQLALDLRVPGALECDAVTPLGVTAEAVFDWAQSTFPYRTDTSMYLKIYGEVAELIGSGGSADEIADMFILLMDYAVRKRIDITQAVFEKLEINRRRTWVTDSNGVSQHV